MFLKCLLYISLFLGSAIALVVVLKKKLSPEKRHP